jgi:BirA family biotin operon repressor/biotin-[acetyl-CoA-carboxylase] ligase
MTGDACNEQLSPAQWSLLRALSNGDEWHDADLARTANLSATQVRRAIGDAADFGVAVQHVAPDRWVIPGGLDLLNEADIRARLPASCPATHIEILGSTTSTNEVLRRTTGAPNGTVCLAEHQSRGRGRRGRRWLSPFASNLSLSLVWHYPGPLGQLGWLSLAIGVAAAECLESLGFADIRLKWPNDLIAADAKLGGILVEVDGLADGSLRVVCGLGINVCMDESTVASVDQPWTSLAQLAPHLTLARSHLAAIAISRCLGVLATGLEDDGALWRTRWTARDSLADRAVSVLRPDGRRIGGVARGITRNGELIVEHDGARSTFLSAEVSVRPDP